MLADEAVDKETKKVATKIDLPGHQEWSSWFGYKGYDETDNKDIDDTFKGNIDGGVIGVSHYKELDNV